MKKFAVGILTAMVGGTMVVSGAGVASASTAARPHTKLYIKDVSPNPVLVKEGAETTAHFNVLASRNVERVELSVAPAGVRTLAAKDVKGLEGWRFSAAFNENDPQGKWKATAVAFDRDGERIATDSAYFYVKQVKSKDDTRISRFYASPGKVHKGRTITFTGRLEARDGRDWDGVRNERVNIYYKAYGSSTWKWVATDRTSWGGKFYAKTRAYKSGSFRAVFSGDRRLEDTTSRSDYVRVYTWHRH
ncbi:hypothetical protein ABZW11_02705 [Nonomuraea sp. NPDC004580]|uniref:hypothetical protein n=1 Tax=Nonomuraea sp. NPDC004580 TaxID=3154552 RepID=UPI0033A0D403